MNINIDRPVVLEALASAIGSLNTLEKPSLLHIAKYTILVIVECHVAVELVHSVDRLSLQDVATIFALKIPRRVFKRRRPFYLVLNLYHRVRAVKYRDQ
jgi:hypothetical protein